MVAPLLRVLAGEPVVPPPIWLMRQAGRYLPEYRELRGRARDFLDLCYTPELAAEVTLQPVRRFGTDAAILFADILLIPDALGQGVRFAEGEGPILDPVRDTRALGKLSLDMVDSHLAPVCETVRLVRSRLPDGCALIGFAGAPWTVATYMVEGGGSRDFGHVKSWAFRDPDAFDSLIDLLTTATVRYLCAQVVAGAQALQLFDTWAGVLPAAGFDRWVIQPARAIVDGVRAQHPDVPIIGFPRGAGILYDRYAAVTGVDAVSLDTQVPLDWAAKTLQPRTVVQGNLDPQFLVVGGTGMQEATGTILSALKDGPRVFNLGHGIVPATPPEHVADLVAYIRGAGAHSSGQA